MKKRLALALCAALLLLCAIVPACADQAVETARPSVNGRLHVSVAEYRLPGGTHDPMNPTGKKARMSSLPR